jgi:hypothetical protein
MDLESIPGFTDLIINAELTELFTKYGIQARVPFPVSHTLLEDIRQDYVGNLAYIISPDDYNAASVEFREALMAAIMGNSRISQESIDTSLAALNKMPDGPLKTVMVEVFGSTKAGSTHQEVMNHVAPALLTRLAPLIKSGQVDKTSLLTMMQASGLDPGMLMQADQEAIEDRNADARARLRAKFMARRKRRNGDD